METRLKNEVALSTQSLFYTLIANRNGGTNVSRLAAAAQATDAGITYKE